MGGNKATGLVQKQTTIGEFYLFMYDNEESEKSGSKVESNNK
jgi:hypothetical protein